MFRRLGQFVNQYSARVLVAAVLFIAVAGWYGLGVFSELSQGDLSDRNSQSTQVVTAVDTYFSAGVAQVIVLFQARGGQTVDSPQFRSEVLRLLGGVQSETISVSSYYTTGAKQLVSADRHSTYAAIVLPGDDGQQSSKIAQLRKQLHSNILDVSVGGQAAANADVNAQVKKDLTKAETVSFVILAVLLVFVFRSLIAALLPLALGGFAILGALCLTRLLAQVVPISQYAINIITLLGLGLAIDYSLFMVSRFREEMRRTRDVSKALIRTMQTAGHTVLFSGMTVIASLLCLQIFPIDFLRSMSYGGTAAVVVALTAAMLVLPAMLRLLGRRVDSLSFGSMAHGAATAKRGRNLKERPNVWSKLGTVFMRHRWLTTSVVVCALVGVGLPFLGAHFSTPDYSSLPVGSESRFVAQNLASQFGDPPTPVRILYSAPSSLTDSNNIAALYAYVQAIRALPEVSSTTSIVDIPNVQGDSYPAIYAQPLQGAIKAQYDQRVRGNTTMIDVNYKHSPDAAATQKLVDQLRSLPKPAGVKAGVGGGPAVLHDLLATIKAYIPRALLALLAVMFILLSLLSRSCVIPIKAIVLSSLALSATFGALVWVFQDGHWAKFLHLTPTGSLDATLPVLIFAVAFGLSVDYSVFLYSRIREEYDANGGDTDKAVIMGLQKTGSIITSAATLLFIVVVAFATGHIPLMQEIGVGLALTVLIDAFIIRMTLVPAAMGILGRANWWPSKPPRKRSR